MEQPPVLEMLSRVVVTFPHLGGQGAVVRVSMDGKGRCFDNIFVERLWRTVKYEDVYLRGYSNPTELREGLKNYFRFYNERRPHQSLGYKSPMEIHRMNGSSVARKAGA